jgi:hypothetical protein
MRLLGAGWDGEAPTRAGAFQAHYSLSISNGFARECSAEAVDSVNHLLFECDDQADLKALRLAQQPAGWSVNVTVS